MAIATQVSGIVPVVGRRPLAPSDEMSARRDLAEARAGSIRAVRTGTGRTYGENAKRAREFERRATWLLVLLIVGFLVGFVVARTV